MGNYVLHPHDGVGEGLRVSQRENTKQLGKGIMIIWGGRTSIQSQGFQKGRQIRLKYSDYEIIRDRARLVRSISPEIIRSDLVAKTPINNGSFRVHGMMPEYQYMRTIEVQWGRPISDSDDAEARPVCILGSEVNGQLFNGANSVGRQVLINGHPFTVAGVMRYERMNSTYVLKKRSKAQKLFLSVDHHAISPPGRGFHQGNYPRVSPR